jgi:hypothetical protein
MPLGLQLGLHLGQNGPSGPPQPSIQLSANTVAENASTNTVIGALSVANHTSGSSGWTFAITSQTPSGKLNISAANLRTNAALDYETNPTLSVLITASKSGQTDLTRTFTINVTNVLEVTLTDLALDDLSYVEGAADSGSITGKTSGSTVTLVGSLPTGLTLDLAAMTWAWDGTGSVSSGSFTLHETHPDAVAHDSVQSWTIAAAGVDPSFSGPTLVAQADPTVFPPTSDYEFDAYTEVGDKLRIQADNDFAFTSPLVNDATVTLDGSGDKAAINAKLAGIASGTNYIRARVEKAGGEVSEWSNIIQHGTAAVPTVTSDTTIDVNEGDPLLATITLSGPVANLLFNGTDQSRFELVEGARPASTFSLRFMDDAVKDFSAPDDFDLDHVYDFGFDIVGLNGKTGTQDFAVTVLDLDTVPDAFSFTDVSDAAPDTLYVGETTVLSGISAGYHAPVSISGDWTRARFHNGTSWGSWLTDVTGVTMQTGYKAQVEVESASGYSSGVSATLTVGGVSDTFSVVTGADPSAASITPSATAPLTVVDAPYDSVFQKTFAFGAGQRGVVIWDGNNRTITKVEIGAVVLTVPEKRHTGEGLSVYIDKTGGSAGNQLVKVTLADGSSSFYIQAFTATELGTVSSAPEKAAGYGRDTEALAAPLVIPDGGVGLAAIIALGPHGYNWTVGTEIIESVLLDPGQAVDRVLSTALVTTTSTPSADLVPGSYPYSAMIGVSWNKAS